MHIELSGFVVIAYTIRGTKDELALTFPADEFSSPDSASGFDNSSGELVYRGVWNAFEENVFVRLSITATRDGLTEKTWHISGGSDDPLNRARVAEDRITADFVEND